jgi:hypothetical protein
MKTVQTITVAGVLAGAAYTAVAPLLQLAGIFTATQDFEILGFQSNFYMQMDYSVLPPVFPVGALLYNSTAPRISLPNSPINTGSQNQISQFLCTLAALNLSQPAAAYAGSPAQIFGSSQANIIFPPGQTIAVRSGSSIACYLRLAGVSAFNSANMINTLLVYM